MNNKFRINLHSAFYDPEILWGSADNTKKDPNEINRTYEPKEEARRKIQEAEKNLNKRNERN